MDSGLKAQAVILMQLRYELSNWRCSWDKAAGEWQVWDLPPLQNCHSHKKCSLLINKSKPVMRLLMCPAPRPQHLGIIAKLSELLILIEPSESKKLLYTFI